jgi:hypothetical protein
MLDDAMPGKPGAGDGLEGLSKDVLIKLVREMLGADDEDGAHFLLTPPGVHAPPHLPNLTPIKGSHPFDDISDDFPMGSGA